MNKKNKILVSILGFLLMGVLVFATTISDTISLFGGINNTGDFITKDPIYDIRAYGAIPDDGLIDDVAIQSAITDAIANPGVIFFPKGTWNVNQTINITVGAISIQGTGSDSTKLFRSANAQGDMIQLYRDTDDEFFKLSDIQLHGNKANNDIGRGLFAGGGSGDLRDIHVYNVFFLQFPEEAVDINSGWGLVFDNNIIEFGLTDAMIVRDGNGGFITSNKIISNNGTSLNLTTNFFDISGNFLEAGGNGSAIIQNDNANIIRGNTIIDDQGSAVNSTGIIITGDRNVISNNIIWGGSFMYNGINLTSTADNNLIIGNTIFKSSAMENEYTDDGTGNILVGKTQTSDVYQIDAQNVLSLNPSANFNVQYFRNAGSGDNREIRQYGHISSAFFRRYISWKVDDVTDSLVLSREANDILGFVVDMPLNVTGNFTIGDGNSQVNMTMTSPDGTEYSCGVANGGTFSCS